MQGSMYRKQESDSSIQSGRKISTPSKGNYKQAVERFGSRSLAGGERRE
uniref:Uncharacterized protein n=1 Tax=Arundo donax TaxID=35708 RepID=A0A0A8YY59_ARUDO